MVSGEIGAVAVVVVVVVVVVEVGAVVVVEAGVAEAKYERIM